MISSFDPSTGHVLMALGRNGKRDNRLKELDKLISMALIGAESASFVQRRRILNLVSGKWQRSMPEVLQALHLPMSRLRELLAKRFMQTYMVAFLGGMRHVESKLPRWLLVELVKLAREDNSIPPWNPRLPKHGADGGDSVRFWILEEAAKRLASRSILTRSQWDALEKTARERAFFVTAPISSDVIGSIRDVMLEDLQDGTSYQGFRKKIEERLEKSPIGYGQLETVYRTNMQAAFRDGRETLLRNPIVDSAFPYQAYVAIHDARARHDHLRLEKLGLNGTNVFRRDDPVWDYFTPPWDYNCRCGVNVLTIEDAARAGVEEARNWLRDGQPPLNPQHRLNEVLRSVTPNPNFGSRGLVYA